MKPARELAIETLWRVNGGMSLALFKLLVEDDSDTGRMMKKFVDAFEATIITDRAAHVKALGPS